MTKKDMQDKLIKLAKESEQELININLGVKINNNITYSVNYRAKQRLGQCCNKKDINISSWLLEVGSDYDIKNTIIHEILHTFDNTVGHKAKWKYYANYVNSKTKYNITRTTSIDNIYNKANKIRPLKKVHYKYEITCEKCGKVFHRNRMATKTINKFMCGKMTHVGCGGRDFKIVDLNKHEVIW